METERQGRGLCVSFHWLVNERTLVGARCHSICESAIDKCLAECFSKMEGTCGKRERKCLQAHFFTDAK